MKSMLQEASTIAKAVEQGWQEAGQPQEFSVKVLELPQRNFIGLTVRSAKIAFMFNGAPQKSVSESSPRAQQKQFTPREKRDQHAAPARQPQIREQREPAPKKEFLSSDRRTEERAPQQRRHSEVLWTDEMVVFGKEWFTTALKHMERPDITFTIEPQHFYLRLTLTQPVFNDEAQEKHLLASLSFLMLSSLKKHFRKALRGHKIVITHAKG